MNATLHSQKAGKCHSPSPLVAHRMLITESSVQPALILVSPYDEEHTLGHKREHSDNGVIIKRLKGEEVSGRSGRTLNSHRNADGMSLFRQVEWEPSQARQEVLCSTATRQKLLIERLE